MRQRPRGQRSACCFLYSICYRLTRLQDQAPFRIRSIPLTPQPAGIYEKRPLWCCGGSISPRTSMVCPALTQMVTRGSCISQRRCRSRRRTGCSRRSSRELRPVSRPTSTLPSLRELTQIHVFCSCNKYPTIECFLADGHVTPNLNMDAATTFAPAPDFFNDGRTTSSAQPRSHWFRQWLSVYWERLLSARRPVRKRQGSFWIVHGWSPLAPPAVRDGASLDDDNSAAGNRPAFRAEESEMDFATGSTLSNSLLPRHLWQRRAAALSLH
jgi:hypothetical protein